MPTTLGFFALVALCLSSSQVGAWLAVSKVSPTNTVDVFQLDDTGTKTKDLVTFTVKPGSVIDPNAFACGRCFCLILTTNPAARTSTLYNMSFCLVPVPTVESQVTLPFIAYNLHSYEGEGDGGGGVTLLIDHTTTPQSYRAVQVIGKAIVPGGVDISGYVDAMGGTVYPGGTGFCAETQTLWVAIQTQDPRFDTLLTLDLGAGKVTRNISMPKPALAAHFADCSTHTLGGVTTDTTLGVTSVYLGVLDGQGNFKTLDSAQLPPGTSTLVPTAVAFLHMAKWGPSEYGALLYAPGGALPGTLLTSTAQQKGPAVLKPMAIVAQAVAVEY